MYIDVYIRGGRRWRFNYEKPFLERPGYYYRTKKNVYCLFIDINEFGIDIWIGREFFIDGNSSKIGWYTVEKELQATHAVLSRGVFKWHGTRSYVKKKK